MPASSSTSASLHAVSGVAEAGLRITALPAANAGAILCATVLSGELNGVIATHHAERHAQREAHAAGLLRRARERDHLAGEATRLLRREPAASATQRRTSPEASDAVKPASICIVRTKSSAWPSSSAAARSQDRAALVAARARRARNAACALSTRVRHLLAVGGADSGRRAAGGTCRARARLRALAGDPFAVDQQAVQGVEFRFRGLVHIQRICFR